MENKLDDYKQKVWGFLDNMEIDKRYTVANLCKPRNHDKFIQTVKDYMDSWPWQGGISFNSDYSKIYKIHLPIPPYFQSGPPCSSIDTTHKDR